MSLTTLAKAQEALMQMIDLFSEFSDVINVCMVDFISDDLFQRLEPPDLRQQLLELSQEDLVSLPLRLLTITNSNRPDSLIDQLLLRIASLSLQELGVCTDKDAVIAGGDSSKLQLQHFDRIMGDKKMHEVAILSDVINNLSQNQGIKSVVDLGSGKGYLSQALTKIFGLNVLAIDASQGNTDGNQKRSQNLEKKWSALMTRAEIRADGKLPPKRGKNWKAKSGQSLDETETSATVASGSLQVITQFVDPSTDLVHLISDHLRSASPQQSFGIVGLHTCGNLASNSLQIFLSNPDAKLLVNVGCCYHHLNEEFYRNPYRSDKDNDTFNADPGFPLSSMLKERSFELGRNARMMAAQPTNRMAKMQEPPSEALFWRAVLQVVLRNHCPELKVKDQQVGKIASKCDDFVSYCRMAFSKLQVDPKVNDADLEQTLEECVRRGFKHKLNVFYQIRSLFASLVEGIILLDRLVFLLEQIEVSQLQRVFLVRLFDPVISPRCYALIATRD